MRQARIVLAGAVVCAILITQAIAAPFVLFPKAKVLASPDGRFVVRNAVRKGAPNEFVGTSLSLWLEEKATGRARKLCDYIGVASLQAQTGFQLASRSTRTSPCTVVVPGNPERSVKSFVVCPRTMMWPLSSGTKSW
jgi:hypothetical protein